MEGQLERKIDREDRKEIETKEIFREIERRINVNQHRQKEGQIDSYRRIEREIEGQKERQNDIRIKERQKDRYKNRRIDIKIEG